MGLKEKAKAGIAWNVIADFSIQVLRFGSSIVLARLLFPQDFGLMGIATIFVNFAKRIASFGFSAALIQKKNIVREHVDSMFWFNLVIYGLVAMGIYGGAAMVGEFFKNPLLQEILPIIALAFFIESLSGVPDALLKRKLKFKQLAFSRLVRNIVNISIAIVMAILGYGVWSLVWGMLIGNIVRLAYILIQARWWPRLTVKLFLLKEMAAFGFGVSLANYMNFFIKNADYFLIGRFLGVEALGYYERAFNLVNMTRRRVARNIKGVLFAAYSQVQDENQKIRLGLHKVLQSVGILSYPIHGLLFFLAPALIYHLYGERWISTIWPLQIMCVSGIINSLIVVFSPILMAKKRVFSWTVVQFIYLVIMVLAIWFALPYGIAGVAWAVAISSGVYLWGMIWITNRAVGFSFKDFWYNQKDILLYMIPTIGGTLGADWILSHYFYPYSIFKALSLMSIFMGIMVGAHLIWQKPFVGEFFDEILVFVKKAMYKVQKRTHEKLVKK